MRVRKFCKWGRVKIGLNLVKTKRLGVKDTGIISFPTITWFEMRDSSDQSVYKDKSYLRSGRWCFDQQPAEEFFGILGSRGWFFGKLRPYYCKLKTQMNEQITDIQRRGMLLSHLWSACHVKTQLVISKRSELKIRRLVYVWAPESLL